MTPSVVANRQAMIADCAQGRSVATSLPSCYAIHLNKPCNQRCIMCVPSGRHPRDLLPFEDFASLFARIGPAAEHVTLIGGEPLMYPWINEVLELLARRPLAVTINTNATMLTRRLTPRLTALHELHLKCSIDAATRETYRRIRGVDAFELVMRHLRDFSTAIADAVRIRLILVYVVMRENLREVLPFLDLTRGLRLNRVEFHPVRHVVDWRVDNGTGWRFDGREQSCEFVPEYNVVMRRAAARCREEGRACEIQLL
jgi:MoaA/NifB/PqqE/SkfB family radical SAM enzyme